MERLTNTIRLTAVCKEVAERDEIHDVLKELIGDLKDVDLSLVKDDVRVNKTYDPLHTISARLYSQPEQRAFIDFLKSSMSDDQKQELLEEASSHLDEHLNFFFRLDKQEFLRSKAVFVHKGDVIQLRLNMCAHPKRQETVLEKLHVLLG